MSGLRSPIDETQMPAIDTAVPPDVAFARLKSWWTTPKDVAAASRAKITRFKSELYDYFQSVETPRFALYASDEVEVAGLSAKTAKMAANVKPAATAAGARSHRDAAAIRDAVFASPATGGGGAAAPATATPIATERLKVYMYNDPLVHIYYKTLETVNPNPAAKSGIRPERSHVLDSEAARYAKINVTASIFSHEKDGPGRGVNVVPDYWEYEVGNLVRKAAFSNRHFGEAKEYPDDRALDVSRKHTMKLLEDARAFGKTAERLIEAYKTDASVNAKYKGDQYELRVRQAQALRYAAQWARAQLASPARSTLVPSRMLVAALYDDVTDAIRDVIELETNAKGATTARKLTFASLPAGTAVPLTMIKPVP